MLFQKREAVQMGNYTFYGKYKTIRNSAWNVLIDFNIAELPVRVIPIAEQMGIEVRSYSAAKNIIDYWGFKELCESNDAFTALIGKQWHFFYDGFLYPRTRIRFALAHELGHFLLGHELKTALSSENAAGFAEEHKDKKKRRTSIETEADMFAHRLLAPACVIWGLNITKAEDIAFLCGICMTHAKTRAARMKILYRRNKFLTDKCEFDLFNQFKPFIEYEKMKIK